MRRPDLPAPIAPALARALPAAALALALAVAGCAQPQAPSAQMTTSGAKAAVGLPVATLVEFYGKPVRTGNNTVTYQTVKTRRQPLSLGATVSLSGENNRTSVSAGRQVLACTWTFRYDAKGVVRSWKNAGELCAALK